MKRRVLAATLAGMMAISLAACGGSTDKESAKGESAKGEEGGSKTLEILLSEDPKEGDALSMMLDKWSEETGNEVVRNIIAYDDQLTKFPAMAKNNDLPDLIATTRLHQLYPDEFVDLSKEFDTSVFEENALKLVGKDYVSDKITGLPYNYTITCMYYNADAFEAAGLEAPTVEDPWTWDELYANAQTLQDKGGVEYGFAADVSRARYDIMMYANGGSLTVKDGDTFKVNVNCPENVATLEKFVEANNTVMPKALWAGATSDDPAEYFKNGDVGIYLSGSWNYNPFSTDVKNFEFGVMPTPSGSAGQSSILGGSALAVPENAKNKDTAIEFLKWLYEEENFSTYLQQDKGLSSLKDVVYAPEDEKAKADFAVLQNEASYMTETFLVDESSAWRNYKDNEYRDYIKRAVSGEMTAQEVLDAFAKELSESSKWEMAQ